ncbi:glycosyltransferase [Paraliobacillus sediminis]|uniref:glycosyltransferase n=1 Tax=Paraliobacillus sediminis TaxID=1885916 RepID=UPI000E3BB39B|nr:glycosyltransferase [Paraliobacillus sediminis]
MKPTIFFLINSIDLIRGGLTKASLKQASFFSEMGYETYMLTFNFNPRYPIIRQKLIDLNKIDENVVIRNMYEELEGYEKPLFTEDPPKKASLEILSEGLPLDKRSGYNAYRVYDNGIYSKYLSLNDNGVLDFIDYFNENRYRTKREEYDPWGNLKKVSFMDINSNKPRQLIYYNKNNKAFLSQWNDPSNEKVKRIVLFDKNNSIKTSYVNDNLSHKIDWLTDIINNTNNDRCIIVSDTRSTDEVLVNFNHQKAAKIWRLHSSHLDAPYTRDANITSKTAIGVNNIDAFDLALFLTEEQQMDFKARFSGNTPLSVVPHYHEINKQRGFDKLKPLLSPSIKKDSNVAIIVSRLSTLKRIDHAIKAFQIVVNRVPSAKLEIWGTGDELSNLKELINQLNLDNNVLLKGYTQNPDEVYQKGLFSIMTSKKEGFALSVLESMYNCTPVISYNIKYGPTDMIVSNDNGFIVENENIQELADKMIYMFDNPKETMVMGKNANKYINKHFNKDIYKQQWLEALDIAMKNKFN